MEQDEDQEMESGSVGVGAWETVPTRVSRPDQSTQPQVGVISPEPNHYLARSSCISQVFSP